MTEKKANNDNLKFWEKVEATDATITRPVTYGKRKFTAIDAYHQIKRATQEWGSYGQKWGLKDLTFTELSEGLLLSQATFYYPDGEFPIASSIKMWTEKTDDKSPVDRLVKRVDDESVKKVVTDMITKALSMLGFNADVFLGAFDGNKYVSNGDKEPAKQYKKPQPVPTETEKRQSQWKDYHEFGSWLYSMKEKGMNKLAPASPELEFFQELGTSCFAHLEAFNEWLNVETSQPFQNQKGETITPKGINDVGGIKSLGHLSVLYSKLRNQRIDKKEEENEGNEGTY